MTRSRSDVLVFALLLSAAVPALSHAQMAGDRGVPPTGGPGGPGMSGGPMGPRDNFTGPPRMPGSPTPGGDFGGRSPIPGAPPSSRTPGRLDVVPLTNVVSMVQERFNATAVKTDTVLEDEELVYRIRLLSADKSRVWTVRVDARTGQVK